MSAEPTPAAAPNPAPVASTETPPVDLTPAVATPKVTVPSADKIIEAIKAKVAEKNPKLGKDDKPAAKDDAKPDDDGAPKLQADPKLVKELGKTQAEKRTLEAKVRELEPLIALKADAEFAKEVRDLWGKTADDKIAALGKLAGKDGIEVLAELVATFYEKEKADGTKDAKGSPPAGDKALLDRLAAAEKEIADFKAGKTSEEDAKKQATAAAEKEAAGKFLDRFLGENKGQFEICARPENRAEAADLIQAATLKILERDKIDPKSVTEEQASDIYMEAAAAVEAEYEATGKRYAKSTPGYVFNPDKYARSLRTKPAVSLKPVTLSPNPRTREEQVRQKLVNKYAK